MTNTNKPNTVFWIIGIIALIWNCTGVYLYLINAFNTEAATADLTVDQIAFMDGMPAWYTAFFAIAVFGGTIASIALLMRKKIAVPFFILSFICAIINQVYWLFGTDAPEIFSDPSPYLMPTIVVVVGGFLIWYSKDQKRKGVLV